MAVVKELIRTEENGGISFGNYELPAKSKVSDLTKYDSATKTSGSLQGISDITSIYSKLASLITKQNDDSESLVDYGFTLDKSGSFDKIKTGDKFLALDNLQDPGNLGTILRTAEALNVTGIVLSADCCDIYSPKVVRGSMGAVFRLPFVVSDTISGYLNAHSELESYAAVVSASADKITTTPFVSPCIVAVGNEGNGLKEETISACKHKITIPMEGRAESLNAAVAASIIMWEMMK